MSDYTNPADGPRVLFLLASAATATGRILALPDEAAGETWIRVHGASGARFAVSLNGIVRATVIDGADEHAELLADLERRLAARVLVRTCPAVATDDDRAILAEFVASRRRLVAGGSVTARAELADAEAALAALDQVQGR